MLKFIRLVLTCLLVIPTTVGVAHETKDDELAVEDDDLRTLTKAAHLRLLSTKDSDEIRVWYLNSYLSPSASGWIVRKDSIRHCKAQWNYAYTTNQMKIRNMKCVTEKSEQKAKEAFAQFDSVAALNESHETCDVLDGTVSVLIEGVRNHQKFDFYSFEPEVCETPRNKEIFALLKALWK
jgi:hypothetical protein